MVWACPLVYMLIPHGLEHMCSSILRRVFLQVCLSPEAGSKAERLPADQIKSDESRSPASLLAVAFSSYMQHVCLRWRSDCFIRAGNCFNTKQLDSSEQQKSWHPDSRLRSLNSSPSKADWPFGPKNNTHTEQVKTDVYTPVPVLADTATELPTNL